MALTPEEKQHLFHRMRMWREECDFQANQYETLRNEPNIAPHRIEMAATYFIIAAGCVYYHAKEILEGKLTRKLTEAFLHNLRNADPDLKAIYDRRTWLNHGAVSPPKSMQANELYSLAKQHHLAIGIATVTGEAKPVEYTLQWADRHAKHYKNMTDWHTKACISLDKLLDNDALLAPTI